MKRHEGAGLLPALVLLAALAACGVSGGPVSGGMNPTGGPAPEAPALEEKGVLSNIVAGREGRVVEIQARQGRPEVSLGDTVTQDQLLIAGL